MGLTTKEIGSSSFNDMISSVDRRSEYVENRAGANVRLNNFLTPYTLDNKSSILNAPCGYSNGMYASLRPVQTIGPELVTNGDFATDSNWTKGTGWSIANGKASRTAQSGSTACDQSISLIAGKKYKIVYTLTISAGSFNVRFSGTTNVNGLSRTTSGTYVDYLVAATGNNTFRLVGANGSFVGSIDNVSVVEVLGNKPRIDYTDSLTSPSFLLEPQSTNLIPYSEGYSQWTWGGNSNPNNTTRVDNQSSPDGGLNASLFTRNSGTSGWFSPQNITVSLNNTFTYSIFVKKNNSSTITLLNVSNSPQSKVVYDIDLNTFTTETNATGNSLNYGNGWYRISMTFEHTNSGGTSAQIRHTLEEGKSMFVFGSQAEQKSFVTSYIPTSGSTATRAAETCNGAGNASTFNDSEGVLYVDYKIVNQVASFPQIQLTDSSLQNQVSFYTYNNTLQFFIKSNNVNTILSSISVSENVDYKFAISYSYAETSIFLNGVKQGSYLNKNMPSNLEKLNIITSDNVTKYKALAVFKEALTDDELQQLTGPEYNSFAALAAAYNYTVI
jgi:hypothetical protein